MKFRSPIRKLVELRETTKWKFSRFFKGWYPMFEAVLIETRTDCTRRCSFCPQSRIKRPMKQMTWSVYKKIVQDLSNMKFSGRVALYITNEPLLDKSLTRKIRYLKQHVPDCKVYISTNGDMLTSRRLNALDKAGIDWINYEDYGAIEQLRAGKEMTFNQFKIIRHPKINYHMRSVKEVLSNRAGTVKKFEVKNVDKLTTCHNPFKKLTINPDGDVVLCCNDYQYKIKVENVMDAPLTFIWHYPLMDQYRDVLLTKKRSKLKLCGVCDYEYFV